MLLKLHGSVKRGLRCSASQRSDCNYSVLLRLSFNHHYMVMQLRVLVLAQYKLLRETLSGIRSYLRQGSTPQLKSDGSNLAGVLSVCVFLYLSIITLPIYYYVYRVDEQVFRSLLNSIFFLVFSVHSRIVPTSGSSADSFSPSTIG